MSRLVLAGLVLAVAAAVGCGGGSEGPRTYPVKGKALYKDDRTPVVGGSVAFESTTDANLNGRAELTDEGAFAAYMISGNRKLDGLTEGAYRVTVHPASPDQSASPIPLPGTIKVEPGGLADLTLTVPGRKRSK
jgi:hypothetical protein